MKSQNAGPRPSGGGKRRPPLRVSPIPVEWMDPMCWRLPSGKALAEFALQAGFLAPLMLGTPVWKKKIGPGPGIGPDVSKIEQHTGEEPEHSGGFRESR